MKITRRFDRLMVLVSFFAPLATSTACPFDGDKPPAEATAPSTTLRRDHDGMHGPGDKPPAEAPAPSTTTDAELEQILTPVAAKVLSSDQTRKLLEELGRYPQFQSYASELLAIPGTIRLADQIASDFPGMAAGKLYKFHPYALRVEDRLLPAELARGAAITIVVPPSFDKLGLNGVCVIPSGFSTPIPARAAEIFDASFACGLCTRLIVGHYSRNAAEFQGKKPNGSGGLDFAQYLTATTRTLPAVYAEIASYQKAEAPAGTSDFDLGLANLLSNHSLTAIGLAYGWKCGGDLDGLQGEDRRYRQVVLDLLNASFSPEAQGEMTAFSLAYLAGYSKVVAIRNAAEARPASHPAVLLASLKDETSPAESSSLLVSFQHLLNSEFQALALNTRMDRASRVKALRLYASFSRGFSAGSTKAADLLFGDTLRLGWGLGYKTGYSNGFSVGYAQGLADGDAAGYKRAWDEARVTIGSLNATIGVLTAQRDQAIDELRKKSGSGSWLSALKDAVDVAKTLVSIFSAL